jgi:hypothetical protein
LVLERSAPAGASPMVGNARLAAAGGTLVETWAARSDLPAWRIRASDGAEAALPAGWMGDLATATRGRWQATGAGAATSGEAWTLLHSGRPQGRLAWTPGSVTVCDLTTGRCEQAPVEGPAQQASMDAMREALRAALRR